jgi:hypothetical protein
MPCYDSRDDFDRRNQQATIDKLTRLLCESMKLHEKQRTRYELMTGELQAWWADHKVVDAKRELEAQKDKIRRSHSHCRPYKGLCTQCHDRAYRHLVNAKTNLCCECFTAFAIHKLDNNEPLPSGSRKIWVMYPDKNIWELYVGHSRLPLSYYENQPWSKRIGAKWRVT